MLKFSATSDDNTSMKNNDTANILRKYNIDLEQAWYETELYQIRYIKQCIKKETNKKRLKELRSILNVLRFNRLFIS